MDRENVPKVLSKDVCDEEVNIVLTIGLAARIFGLNHKVWSRGSHCQNGLDLNAPKSLFGADNDVVAVALAPGLGNGESEVGGLAHESEFGEFASVLGVELGCMYEFV